MDSTKGSDSSDNKTTKETEKSAKIINVDLDSSDDCMEIVDLSDSDNPPAQKKIKLNENDLEQHIQIEKAGDNNEPNLKELPSCSCEIVKNQNPEPSSDDYPTSSQYQKRPDDVQNSATSASTQDQIPDSPINPLGEVPTKLIEETTAGGHDCITINVEFKLNMDSRTSSGNSEEKITIVTKQTEAKIIINIESSTDCKCEVHVNSPDTDNPPAKKKTDFGKKIQKARDNDESNLKELPSCSKALNNQNHEPYSGDSKQETTKKQPYKIKLIIKKNNSTEGSLSTQYKKDPKAPDNYSVSSNKSSYSPKYPSPSYSPPCSPTTSCNKSYSPKLYYSPRYIPRSQQYNSPKYPSPSYSPPCSPTTSRNKSYSPLIFYSPKYIESSPQNLLRPYSPRDSPIPPREENYSPISSYPSIDSPTSPHDETRPESHCQSGTSPSTHDETRPESHCQSGTSPSTQGQLCRDSSEDYCDDVIISTNENPESPINPLDRLSTPMILAPGDYYHPGIHEEDTRENL